LHVALFATRPPKAFLKMIDYPRDVERTTDPLTRAVIPATITHIPTREGWLHLASLCECASSANRPDGAISRLVRSGRTTPGREIPKARRKRSARAELHPVPDAELC
jgi:hypothetical protein